MINRLVVLFIGILFTTVFANEPWFSRDWLNLMFYEQKSPNSYQSLVDGTDYFLTKNGMHDPKAEYDEALRLTKAQDPVFKQTFPLRYKRLALSHNILYLPNIEVDSSVDSVVLTYPGRYMGSLSSLFGHLFLIFKKNDNLLDSRIFHFIADPVNARGMNFVFGGLSGQFKGRFLNEPFHKKIKEYNHEDDREITYYDLRLPKNDIDDLQLLAIDLKTTYFYYFFKDENCAFYIGKVLNIILDKDAITKTFYIAPSDIINRLIDSDRVTSKKTRHTQTQQFLDAFHSLNGLEKRHLNHMITQKINSNNDYSKGVLRSFLYISEFIINNYPQLSDIIRYNRFISYQKLSVTNDQNVRQPLSKSPIKRIPSKRWAASYTDNHKVKLSWSPLFYETEFGDFELNRINALMPGILLDSTNRVSPTLTLFDVNNIETYNDFFGGASWRTSGFFLHDDGLGGNVSFEYGYGKPFFNLHFVSAFFGVQASNYNTIENNMLNDTGIYTSFTVGLNQKVYQHFIMSTDFIMMYNTHYIKPTLAINFGDAVVKMHYTFIPKKSDFFEASIQYFY